MTDKSVREKLVERERAALSPYATLSEDTRGRQTPLTSCPFRTEFQRDRDRIIHCQSFRRLMYKTQVFLAPAGDHYRTRLTHTLEVCQVALCPLPSKPARGGEAGERRARPQFDLGGA